VVGCTPDQKPLPSFVKCIGVLSKKKHHDIETLKKLYQEAHFLFVPSLCETFGIVFCEANAFGVPCITTHVGGIPDVVKDGVNGMTFSLEASIQDYCDYIINIMSHNSHYETLALDAFNEYETRLNWQTAAAHVKKLIAEII
jgi:glycosyltransferase involved in cell wall biosynthesis